MDGHTKRWRNRRRFLFSKTAFMHSNGLLMEPDTATYGLAQSVMHSRVGDQIFLLESKKGIYYELNATGTHVWERLQSGAKTQTALIESLAAEFGQPMDAVTADLTSFLDGMLKKGLIERAD